MPSYKVTYFDGAGRAEKIRMLLKYGNIPFVDERITHEDWAKIKPTTPLGQLPVLQVDDIKIPQSIAICRYLANEIGIGGKDNKENLKIDIALATMEDVSKLAEAAYVKDSVKKEEKLKEFKEKLPFYLEKFEEQAKKNGGYIAINRLTLADIVFINIYEFLRSVNDGEEILKPYPSLQQAKENVLSNTNIRDWIKTRPKGSFPSKYDLKQDV